MPDVKSAPQLQRALKRLLFHAMKMISDFPGLGGWAQNEMSTATQCLAVIVDQRLLHESCLRRRISLLLTFLTLSPLADVVPRQC